MEAKLIKVCKHNVTDYDEKGVVTVGANAFNNEDSDGDISIKGSYSKTLKDNLTRMRWLKDHDRHILLGIPIEGQETDTHLAMRGKLNLNKEVSRDAYEDYKLFAEFNRSLEHSVMVQAIKRDNADQRRVLEWKMWEYSTLSTWGANSDTPMFDIKSSDNLEDALLFMELCLRKGNYTDDRGKQMEQHITKIRSLMKEPPSTLEDKPNEETINFIKNLKLI